MRSSERAFLGWIVLVLYFASTTVASRSVVVCLEVDGGSAIEFAGDHGQCLGDAASGSETGHPDCRNSCCKSCPCDDSSLAIPPALVGATPDMQVWTATRSWLSAWPTPTRPDAGAAVAGDVTRRSLGTVVLLL